MPNVGNTPQFRALLWTNIEKILDLIYTYVAQLSNLARVLAKKKDPITHTSFLDELIKVSNQRVRRSSLDLSFSSSMDIPEN